MTNKPVESDNTELREKLADLVEAHFPKGECKERGQAMVLVAYAEMLFESLLQSSNASLLKGLLDRKELYNIKSINGVMTEPNNGIFAIRSEVITQALREVEKS